MGWVLVRFGGIALGVITLLGFASGYMNVEFKPYFRDVLDTLQYLADYIVQPELIERGLDWLRQHFAWVPKPDAHWKPLYTLSALLMVSMARHSYWYMIPVALVCSLVPAVFAGTMPVGSAAVVGWPAAGLSVFLAILDLLHRHWWGARIFAAAAAAFAAAGYFIGTTGESTGALVLLVFMVGFLGLSSLVDGLRKAEGDFWQRLQHPATAIGLDVTATLGLALAIGYLVAA